MKNQIVSQSIQMNNGTVLEGDKISELTKHFINKFADEGLSLDEAIIVINRVKNIIGEFAIVQHLD